MIASTAARTAWQGARIATAPPVAPLHGRVPDVQDVTGPTRLGTLDAGPPLDAGLTTTGVSSAAMSARLDGVLG